MLLLALACSEYSTFSSNDVTQPVRDDDVPLVTDSGEEHTHDSDVEEDDEDPPDGPDDPDEPPRGDPPDDFGDCDNGIEAPSPSEIYVLSWTDTDTEGVITAPLKGWYDVYSDSIAESGSSQTNESAYFRIPNGANPAGTPAWSNCDSDWIVQDADNSGFPGGRIYIGTFWLAEGENKLEMHHFCPLQRSGACDSLHITSDSSGTCDSGNVNSVHFYGSGICIEKR
ncbi:MAG: hypothetical protein GY913_11415 [Proteobacteria bacterium]|nr:hypothetical protein [Pseudomonadota bacterium]MCP4917523.1 hypothetical protein [Pseudomonadota bacterium]